jgi:hypothetical protein
LCQWSCALNDAIFPVREYGQTIAVNKLNSDTFVGIEQRFGTSNDDNDDDDYVMMMMMMVLVVMIGCKEQRR